MPGAAETLFLPFASGDIDPPAEGQHFAYFNAALPSGELDAALKAALLCEQGYRPEFRRLGEAGFEVSPVLGSPAGTCAAALVLAGKHRDENRRMIARACAAVATGGLVAVSGDKSLGIGSLRKWAGERVEILGSLAKHHAAVFWFAAPERDAFAASPETGAVVNGRFETGPGMFSHGKPDRGSQLLAEHFGPRISGKVADFGCGWGYLSVRLLEVALPDSLALFEAHYPSLQAAGRNVARVAPALPVTEHWTDLRAEPVARQFDWIVMNPPFHAGRSAEPDIGKAFVRAASAALLPGGRLLMVANRKLPYEDTLSRSFRRVTPLSETEGYKLIEAVR
ncbi:class I SAM-dependent methyltransferase [Oricola sp.]|uniref:class I SAM-dependent methyltransferase n=1 Tax=Oricola sp. TaxID=1979950 RepID=UPI003BAC74E8